MTGGAVLLAAYADGLRTFGPDPLLLAGLSPARGRAPPALAAALSLSLATLLSLARDAAVRGRVAAGFGSRGAGGSGVLGDAVRETGLVLAALPAHALLFAHLWARGAGGGGGSGAGGRGAGGVAGKIGLVAAAPLSALSLAAGRCSSTKWLAAGSLAAVAVVAAQRGLGGGAGGRAGRRARGAL